MKIEMSANISLNGQILLEKEHGRVLYGPPELINQALVMGAQSGAMVVGRTTYGMFGAAVQKAVPGMEILVLTSHPMEGVQTASSVQEAVSYLRSRGYERVTLGGGVSVWDAFLKENLVDDIYFNVYPVVTSGGGSISPRDGFIQNYRLVESKDTDGILSVHYTKA